MRRLFLILALIVPITGTAYAETQPRQGPYDARVRQATRPSARSLRAIPRASFWTACPEARPLRSSQSRAARIPTSPSIPTGAVTISMWPRRARRPFTLFVSPIPRQPLGNPVWQRTNQQTMPMASARDPRSPRAKSGEIWDDGTFTYFRFAANAPLPAIFRWSAGNERSVNALARPDGVIRVSGVSDRWVLRLGEDEICVQEMSEANQDEWNSRA